VAPRDDVGPHVTVLVPSPDDAEAIAHVLAPFDPFDVTFARVERFPGAVWLAPDPAEPFVAMTEAMVDRFPAFPPYRGAFDEIVPHLTVAEARLDETEALMRDVLPLRARVEAVVLYEHVEAEHWRAIETFRL
jgi:2'-5' RNA ligase